MPRLRIDEAIVIEGTDLDFRRLRGVAEDQFDVRIGGDGRGGIAGDRADVHAFVNRFEQTRKRVGARFTVRRSTDHVRVAGSIEAAPASASSSDNVDGTCARFLSECH
jgi:hypothetical protein